MISSARSEPPAIEPEIRPGSSGKTVLIADPDREAAGLLAASLRRRGHRVLTVRDGSKALEIAILRAPDLVLYDVACPLLEARMFAEILRANPRTAAVPVVLVGPEGAADTTRAGLGERFLQKPFNLDEVLARITQLLGRLEAAKKVAKTGSVEGSLDQMSLPDMLQILSINRRSGTLRLSTTSASGGKEQEGEILLADGMLQDAKVGKVRGVKALYRCLMWDSGAFTFIPGKAPAEQGERIAIEELLLEGLRQRDELQTLEEAAPEPEELLALTVESEQLPDGLHPVTAEVVRLLDQERTFSAILDAASSMDLAVTRAIVTLVQRGLVRVLGRASDGPKGRPLVPADVAFAIHGWAMTSGGIVDGALRVLVAAPEPSGLETVVSEMVGIDGWMEGVGPCLSKIGFGSLGEVAITEAVSATLTALPVEDGLSPLWRAYGADAVGAVVIDGPGVELLVEHLVHFGVPVVLAGDGESGGTSAVREKMAGKVTTAPSFVQGLSRLLRMVGKVRRRRA